MINILFILAISKALGEKTALFFRNYEHRSDKTERCPCYEFIISDASEYLFLNIAYHYQILTNIGDLIPELNKFIAKLLELGSEVLKFHTLLGFFNLHFFSSFVLLQMARR